MCLGKRNLLKNLGSTLVKNDELLLNVVVSLLIILGAMCFFFLKEYQPSSHLNKPINIILNNLGYQPALIQIPAGKEVKLHIVRIGDACNTSVEFPKLNITYPFMLDIPVNVTLPPQAPGIIDFNCQGGGARGRIVVV